MLARSVSRDSKVSNTRARVRYRSEGIGKRLRIFLLEMTRASNSTYFASIETASSSSVSFHLASNRPVSQVNACEASATLSPISYQLSTPLARWIQNTSDTARIEVKHLFLDPLPASTRVTFFLPISLGISTSSCLFFRQHESFHLRKSSREDDLLIWIPFVDQESQFEYGNVVWLDYYIN